MCPWCEVNIEGESLSSIRIIKISIPSSGARYAINLHDGQPTILGRSNLGHGAQSVSSRHLEITPFENRIFLRHIGRYPTAILRNDHWYNLRESWIHLNDITHRPLSLRLADTLIDIGV